MLRPNKAIVLVVDAYCDGDHGQEGPAFAVIDVDQEFLDRVQSSWMFAWQTE